jgi:hypothetical protein
MIKRRIFTKLRFQVGRHSSFSTKWRCLIFLVGFFRSLGSGDEKGIDFYQRGCLRLWYFQSSVLEVAKKYIIAKSSCFFFGSGDTVFSQRKFDLPAVGKSRWIFHSGWEKQVDFSSLSPKVGWRFQMANGNILYNSSWCAEVVHRRLWSGILNPPDDFSVVLLEDVIVEDWGGSTNSLPREGPGNCYCDWILTIGEGKMLERRRRSSSFGVLTF